MAHPLLQKGIYIFGIQKENKLEGKRIWNFFPYPKAHMNLTLKHKFKIPVIQTLISKRKNRRRIKSNHGICYDVSWFSKVPFLYLIQAIPLFQRRQSSPISWSHLLLPLFLHTSRGVEWAGLARARHRHDTFSIGTT